jgi:hypothetical protein
MYKWLYKPTVYVFSGFVTAKLFGLCSRIKDYFYLNDKHSDSTLTWYVGDRQQKKEIIGFYIGLFGSMTIDKIMTTMNKNSKLIEN